MQTTLTAGLAALREFHGAKRFVDAERLGGELLARWPDNALLLHHCALTGLLGGRPDLAVPALKRAVALEPGNAGHARALAAAFKAMGRLEEALAAAEQALAILSRHPATLDIPKINAATPTHHVQHRPLNHVRFRKSLAAERILAGYLAADPANADDLGFVYALFDNVVRVLARGAGGALAMLGGSPACAQALKGAAPGRSLHLFGEQDWPAIEGALIHPGPSAQALAALSPGVSFAAAIVDPVMGAQALGAVLAPLHARIDEGGLLVLRAYANDSNPTVTETFDAFLAGRAEGAVLLPDKSGSAFLVKPTVGGPS